MKPQNLDLNFDDINAMLQNDNEAKDGPEKSFDENDQIEETEEEESSEEESEEAGVPDVVLQNNMMSSGGTTPMNNQLSAPNLISDSKLLSPGNIQHGSDAEQSSLDHSPMNIGSSDHG